MMKEESLRVVERGPYFVVQTRTVQSPGWGVEIVSWHDEERFSDQSNAIKYAEDMRDLKVIWQGK
jgi:hypothetical protein